MAGWCAGGREPVSTSSPEGGSSRQPSGEAVPEEDQVVRMHRRAATTGVDITRPDITAGEIGYTARLGGELIARSRDLRMLLDAVERQLGDPHGEAGEP